MKYETIEQIYEGNAKVRGRLKALLGSLTDEQISARPEGEKWTIGEIVEHITIVDESTMKICAKLLHKAQEAGKTSDGSVKISDNFVQKGTEIARMKVEAPTMVQPTGSKSIAESLAKLDATTAALDGMRDLFETTGCDGFTFPHPFFGDITAQEWLALKGGHEMRHLKQIEKVLEKIN